MYRHLNVCKPIGRYGKSTKKSGSSGGTYTGILIGLILGLGAAVAVALFVTKVPMPFVDKASRDKPTVALPEGRDLLDPNRDLYGSSSGQTPPPGGTIPGLTLPPVNLPNVPKPAAPDALGDLIATLPSIGSESAGQPEARRTPAPTVAAPAVTPSAPSAPAPAASKPAAPAPAAPCGRQARHDLDPLLPAGGRISQHSRCRSHEGPPADAGL